MRDLVVLFIHFIATLARLLGPGGARSIVAESLLLKHQLLILNRSRRRSPKSFAKLKKHFSAHQKGILPLSMPTTRAKIWDILRLLRHGGPALCNVAVTNSCNATCDFCNFANGKIPHKDLRWMEATRLDPALQILHGRGIRYVSFFGGEPLLHPQIAEMIALRLQRAWERP